jgi:hypothetical protein
VSGALALLGAAGLAVGLWLLVRGMGGFRQAAQIGDTSTSPIGSAAAGEVRVSGTVEPAELVLTSPLQSVPCVYYRATVEESGRDSGRTLYSDEHTVGFRVRDATGTLRVFPRGAQFDVPLRYDDRDGSPGERPPGLQLRTGDAVAMAREDRETQIARLLTVRAPSGGGPASLLGETPSGPSGTGRRYREARLEPGETVTIVGHLLPFGDLPDPLGASDVTAALDPLSALADPEIAADLAEARAEGLLESDPLEAWGNAAIPGFGIGRPVRPPELDPAAQPPRLAGPDEAARAEDLFEIAPEELVLAATPDWPLLVATGAPGDAVERHENRFLVGLLGAALAIGSAVLLALSLSGTLAA